MNKQLKGILAGCGVLALLGGGLAWLLLNDPGTGNEESSSGSSEEEHAELWQYTSDHVSKVRVEQPGKEPYTAIRRWDETQSTDYEGNPTVEKIANYYLEGYDSLPMNTISIRLLTTRSTSVNAVTTIAENVSESDLAQYGLDKPVKVTLTVDDADDVSFLIGSKTPVSSYTYLSMAGSSTVYTVSTSDIEPYLTDVLGYLGTEVNPEQAEDDERTVQSTRITRKGLDYDLYFVYDPFYAENANSGSAAMHVMEEPIHALLNVDKSNDATHGLFGLNASEVLTPFPQEADLTKAGLDDPFIRVTTVMSDGKTMELRIGNTYTDADGNTKYYGYFEGVDCIYGFSPDSFVYETVTADDVASRIIIDMYVWDVSKVRCEADGETLDFSVLATDQSDAVVQLNGESYENVERYRQLYSFLLKTAAEDLILTQPDDVGAEMASVYVEAKDGKRSYDIKFYEASGLKAYVSVDGQIRFRCRKSYVTTLIDNIKIFGDEEKAFTMSW